MSENSVKVNDFYKQKKFHWKATFGQFWMDRCEFFIVSNKKVVDQQGGLLCYLMKQKSIIGPIRPSDGRKLSLNPFPFSSSFFLHFPLHFFVFSSSFFCIFLLNPSLRCEIFLCQTQNQGENFIF